MSNENETTGGEHNAEKPIIVEHDTKEFGIGKFGYDKTELNKLMDGIDLTQLPTNLEPPPIEEKIELSLSEAIRVIEATVKFLNHTKNEGRHEVRITKDKENQHKLNQIRDEVVDFECKNISMVEAYEKIQEIVSSSTKTKITGTIMTTSENVKVEKLQKIYNDLNQQYHLTTNNDQDREIIMAQIKLLESILDVEKFNLSSST